ncbi:MAG: histidine kinase dimerization/phospho-acceptor domain-containing protein [Lachnospira eligens]
MSEQAAKEKTLQLRANLLRTISHDLRTPLTSISGNANNLMYNYDKLDNDTESRYLQIYMMIQNG